MLALATRLKDFAAGSRMCVDLASVPLDSQTLQIYGSKLKAPVCEFGLTALNLAICLGA
jgi:hypothetical protein